MSACVAAGAGFTWAGSVPVKQPEGDGGKAGHTCQTDGHAARGAQMSYRHAWDLINVANKHLGKKLILPQSGGVSGGRSVLSVQGRQVLEMYKLISKEVAAYADARFAAYYSQGWPANERGYNDPA